MHPIISREEVSAIIYRILTDYYRQIIYFKDKSFSDVEIERWSNESISSLKNGEIILGYPDGEFKAKNKMTRAELVVILSRLEDIEATDEKTFNDV